MSGIFSMRFAVPGIWPELTPISFPVDKSTIVLTLTPSAVNPNPSSEAGSMAAFLGCKG